MARERTTLGLPGPGRQDVAFDTAGAQRGAGPLDRYVARKIAQATDGAAALVLWDGEAIEGPRPPGAAPPARIRIADRGALFRLALDPDLAFGDLYSAGRVDIDGDLLPALVRVYRGVAGRPGRRRLARKLQQLRSAAPSLRRSRRNIHHHYDLGNDFYRLWLDREAMQYTCAYYPEAEMTLEAAQRAKMDHVCRKLWLRPGERVVEAGCGWGGFALHMARAWGARVRAFNISREQIAFARERARQEGLADRVEFVEDDYRNISGRYDAFVSVGMLEHVGRGNYRELGRLMAQSLGRGGRGLVHSIGRDRDQPLNPWIARRIFPGADPPPLRAAMELFEPAGLSVLDVENLRLHYARTLADWRARYEAAIDRVSAMFDRRFARAWRLYLAGSEAAFVTGSLQLFQIVFAPAGADGVPRSRAHLHGGPVELEGAGGS